MQADLTEISSAIDEIFAGGLLKIVISKPLNKDITFRKITINLKEKGWQIEKLTDKQAFHENIGLSEEEELKKRCAGWLLESYARLNAWNRGYEFLVMVSKKGRISVVRKPNASFKPEKIQAGHNRKKKYIFNEGDYIEPMIDMGIMTKDARIVRSMYDKFKQINRFAEIIDDAVRDKNYDRLNIVDFGCGKSYLTFILYYYFTQVKKMDVTITGLDLKADVIAKCNEAAVRYGYDGLKFEVGDINGYQSSMPVDMVVTLHACDTATDYALYNAVKWNARMIFSVPCCQHELNNQMESDKLSLLTKYSLIRERSAALITDAIRGSLLEYCGYRTQLMEFVDFAHTPKNILIRAEKTGNVRRESLEEVRRAMREFNLNPTLYRLLCGDDEA